MTPLQYLKFKLQDQGGWIPAAIAAGATLIGGILGNRQSSDNTAAANAQAAQNQASANQANLTSAREQMAFQERMSNSSYQRAMADMGKAGLNPILAYQQGGASTPSGASANAGAASVSTPNYEDPLGKAVNSGADVYNKTAQLKLGMEGLKLGQANSAADIALKAAQVNATTQSAKNAIIQGEVLKSEAKKKKLEGDWASSETGKELYKLNQINEAAGNTLDTLNSGKSLLNPMKLLEHLKKPNKRGSGTMKDGTQFNIETGEIYKP